MSAGWTSKVAAPVALDWAGQAYCNGGCDTPAELVSQKTAE